MASAHYFCNPRFSILDAFLGEVSTQVISTLAQPGRRLFQPPGWLVLAILQGIGMSPHMGSESRLLLAILEMSSRTVGTCSPELPGNGFSRSLFHDR